MARHGVAETLTGAAVLLVAVGFLAYAVAHSGRTASTGYSLQARFDRIDGLNVGGDVRIAGVKVGSVTSEQIDPKTFSAIVTMTVRNDIQLPKDSAAAITSESLLGGKYISLSPGGDDATIKPGEMITITQSSVSLEELLGKFIFSATSLSSPKKSGDPSQGGNAADRSAGAGDGNAGDAAATGKAGGAALAPLPK
jgi:phospholipid/cholesterol/gamma-HCH transport system substrate-binding protein